MASAERAVGDPGSRETPECEWSQLGALFMIRSRLDCWLSGKGK